MLTLSVTEFQERAFDIFELLHSKEKSNTSTRGHYRAMAQDMICAEDPKQLFCVVLRSYQSFRGAGLRVKELEEFTVQNLHAYYSTILRAKFLLRKTGDHIHLIEKMANLHQRAFENQSVGDEIRRTQQELNDYANIHNLRFEIELRDIMLAYSSADLRCSYPKQSYETMYGNPFIEQIVPNILRHEEPTIARSHNINYTLRRVFTRTAGTLYDFLASLQYIRCVTYDDPSLITLYSRFNWG